MALALDRSKAAELVTADDKRVLEQDCHSKAIGIVMYIFVLYFFNLA